MPTTGRLTQTTGQGTQDEIVWDIPPPLAWLAPTPTSLPPLTTPQPLNLNPTLSSTLKDGTRLSGPLSLEWWIDPTNGLSIQNVNFKETTGWKPGAVHVLGQYLQWRNLRLIFDGVAAPVLVPLTNALTSIAMLNGTGTRSSDGKQFGFAATTHSIVKNVADPRAAGVSYDVDVQHAFLFGMPASDQEPTHTVHAIKLYPTLTVSLTAHGTVPGKPPDIAADLKMIHAPKVTRDFDPTPPNTLGQRLPAASYQGTLASVQNVPFDPGDVVAFLGCDTNDTSRPTPGGIIPTPPNWDYVFDYFIPGIRYEMLIDAVVYPRGPRGNRPSFTIPWSPASPFLNPLNNGTLTCYREPGQGEYDNLHITPYLGFDDPKQEDPTKTTAPTEFPWIEAPIAADEVIHLHWRWGTGVPGGATKSPQDFKGWGDLPTAPNAPPPRPNKIEGAPLIPPNQSLRIKVARSDAAGSGDNTNDPSSAPATMTKMAVTVWYMATVHQPVIGSASQFFGQGYGLAMYMETLKTWAADEENWELLTGNLVKPNYHNFRWTNGGQQRVPNGEPALSRNKLTNLSSATWNDPVTLSTSP
jgi:hypothetical protein